MTLTHKRFAITGHELRSNAMNVNETDNDFSFPEISEREIACERLVFNTTEDILLAMQDSGVSYAELAKRLGKSKSHVSQILNGTRNMTLRTLADISYVIDCEIKLTIYKNGVDVSHQIMTEDHYVSTSSDLTVHADKPALFSITLPAMDVTYAA